MRTKNEKITTSTLILCIHFVRGVRLSWRLHAVHAVHAMQLHECILTGNEERESSCKNIFVCIRKSHNKTYFFRWCKFSQARVGFLSLSTKIHKILSCASFFRFCFVLFYFLVLGVLKKTKSCFLAPLTSSPHFSLLFSSGWNLIKTKCDDEKYGALFFVVYFLLA